MRDVKAATKLFVCLLMIGVTSTAAAQTFEITPFGGWRFGGGFADLETGADLDLEDSVSYGVILSIPWNDPPRSRAELIWSRQDTTVSPPNAGDPLLDLDVQYLHIGGMVPFKTPNDRLETLISGVPVRPSCDRAPTARGQRLFLAQRRCRTPLSRLGPHRDPPRGSRVLHLHRGRCRDLLRRRVRDRLLHRWFRTGRIDGGAADRVLTRCQPADP